MNLSLRHLRPIFYALAGFSFWVLADTCMKLGGEARLPFYELVGFMGLFASLALALFYAPQGRVRELWPQNPKAQTWRVAMAVACATTNTFALNHLPLTVFYVVVFTAPMMIAVLASVFLKEHLTWQKIAAIVVGFIGVVIAIDPWNSLDGGDWIGYAAAAASALFFAIATVLLRFMTQSETPQSMTFFTAFIEAILGLGLMLWHMVSVAPMILALLALMGAINAIGNLLNSMALKYVTAATVEQFHYTQIIMGAFLGWLIWHDVPTLPTIIGAVVIIASGLYVAAATHQAEKTAARLTNSGS